MALCLNSRNDLLGYNVVSVGSLNASIVDPREILESAILLNVAMLVIGHSHRSGDPAPSREDRGVTRVLSHAWWLLEIPLHDHVILGAASYFSFRDQGLL